MLKGRSVVYTINLGLRLFCVLFCFEHLDTQDDKERIKKYGAFIRSLPGVNRATLAAVIEHLYR